MSRLVDTLRELVGIDSTSALANGPIIDVLEARLRAAGFRCERHAYVDEQGVEKVNLLGLRGPAGRPELALVGHSDCVPYDAGWAQARVLTEEDGKLYGRGACDTKGFIAAALEAVARVPAAEQKKPLMVLFTADEELGCVGAKRLVEEQVQVARYAVVGEPTSLVPIRGNKGYCLAQVEVKGREGHSAYPEVGVNAIFHAARFLRRLEDATQTVLRAEVDPSFEPPFTTVNVGVIEGGKAKNIIPGSCRFTVEWRPIPTQPVERVAELLAGVVERLKEEDDDVDIDVRVLRADRGVDTPADSEIVRFLVTETAQVSQTVPFGTEAPQLTQLGAEAVVFGPGDIRVAHRTGEYVPVKELERCAEVLERAVRRFCCAG